MAKIGVIGMNQSKYMMKSMPAVLLLLLPTFVVAQDGEGGGPLKSPEVLQDNRVVFRIRAPKASEVTVGGDWIAQGRGTGGPLQKDTRGVWSITVGPLVPDVYSYTFNVDGVQTLDPANVQIKVGVASKTNYFVMAGPESAFEAHTSVPHGEIREVWYQSGTFNIQRRMHVYTPPGYETSGEKYPILYLINGGGDEDSGWSTLGRAGFILDNLIAAKRAKPMILVMPNGTVSLPSVTPAMTAQQAQSTPEGNRMRVTSLAKLHDAFGEDLLGSVLPYAEKNYRVAPTAANRAIAGLSMGGAETIRVGLQHFDKFAWIGVFSMGPQPGMNGPFTEEFEQHNAKFLSNPQQTNKMVKLIWIGVGKDDRTVGQGPKNLAEGLKRHGINSEFHETEGGHTWINWRHYLNDFAPLLFR